MPRAGLTAGRLAEAGAELADEAGFGAVTITELARRVGVKPASLYAHVESTADLRTRVALLALEELTERTAQAVAGRAGADALAALGDAYRDYARAHPGRFEATLLPLDADAAMASAGPRHALLVRAILRGYDLTDEDETHAVRLLGSTFRGFVSLELSGGFSHSAPGSQESWVRIIDGLDTLLRTWTAPRPSAPSR